MKNIIARNVLMLIILFIASRIIFYLCGISMDYSALEKYWQYLDTDSLRNNLLLGVWYDHTQPPVFNFFLGIVLKLAGMQAPTAFVLIYFLISFLNVLMLYRLIASRTGKEGLALIIAIIYLLSPGTVIFENELFYTSFISFFLLLMLVLLARLQKRPNLVNAGLFFLSIVIVALTRSMYHLVWVVVLSLFVIYKLPNKKMLIPLASISLLIITGWYVKNYYLFNRFTASTWLGMNVARNVFHDAAVQDYSSIEGIEPFEKIDTYRIFLDSSLVERYQGVNDVVLIREYKNDSFVNAKHIDYILVADKYMTASKKEVRAHPMAYFKNVIQSAISFFAPATRYPPALAMSQKLHLYDAVYSFNLSQFANGKEQRRLALAGSAIPKMLFYVLIIGWTMRRWYRNRKLDLPSILILLTIGYIFTISSLLEHYENMRFRYEIEPLFLILAGTAIASWLNKRRHTTVL